MVTLAWRTFRADVCDFTVQQNTTDTETENVHETSHNALR